MPAPAVAPIRAVQCRHCGKPVSVPRIVAKRQTRPPDLEQSWESKSFALRCHTCRKESVYTTNEIVDCSVD
jgi:hypothetical protein